MSKCVYVSMCECHINAPTDITAVTAMSEHTHAHRMARIVARGTQVSIRRHDFHLVSLKSGPKERGEQ